MAGKCFRAYLCLFADFCASCRVYSYIYTVNLEFEDKFKGFYDYIYLYIYDFYRRRLSYEWASYPEALSVKTYTLVYFSSKASLLMIKSHDKYQSIILIGLAYVEKAYSKIRSISVHNRSYWRELQPLVAPWAWCIKEGTEPWRVQKRPFLSHVQVSLLPLCLSSPSLALFCFYCFIIIVIIIYYVYLLVKGIITVTNKPGPEYSKYQRYKPGYLNSKGTLTPSLSSQMAIISEQAISHIQCCQLGSLHYIGAGYLTFIISTALSSPIILLYLSSHMAIICEQAISHIQYRQLGSLHYIGAGYLTFIISTALPSLLTLSSPLGLWLILLDGVTKRYGKLR